MRTILVLSILAVSVAPVACGSGAATPPLPDAGDSSSSGGDSGHANDSGDAGHKRDSGDAGARDATKDAPSGDGDAEPEDAADGGSDAPSSSCPASPPAPFSPCTELEQYCSWGTDPRFQCRTRAECNAYYYPDGGTPPGLVWRTGDDDVPAQTCPTPAPSCPTISPPLSDGGSNPPCDEAQAGLTCQYGGVAITCAPCPGPTLCFSMPDGGFPYQWYQTKLADGCPEAPPGGPLPNWGTACSDPGLHCVYNNCASSEPGAAPWAEGMLFRCQSDGTWTGLGAVDAGACL